MTTKTANAKTWTLVDRAAARGIRLSFDQARTLRRASLTLSRWSEQESGDSNDYCSWAIERDPETGKPMRCVYPHKGGSTRRTPIRDLEAGALRRIAAVCAEIGAHYYHQTDPRGAALYLASEPLTRTEYTRGMAI